MLFPIAPYVVEDLDLHNCGLEPIERDVVSVNMGDPGDAPFVMYNDPLKMADHLTSVHGADALGGFMGLAAFAQPVARLMDRFNPKHPPRTVSEMFAEAKTWEEQEALRLFFFGSVMP